jgi:transcriptional regulator with XRE-family HTH domain
MRIKEMSEQKSETTSEYRNDLILKLRNALGLTQQQLASRAGVSRNIINKVETGGHDMKVTTLSGIANGLGVDRRILLDMNLEIDLSKLVTEAAEQQANAA